MKLPRRVPTAAPVLATLALALILSGCAGLGKLLPGTNAVEWIDGTVYLGVYLDMSPLPAPFEQEDSAGRVAAFTGSVDTSGTYTINDDQVCAFDLAAEAAYDLDLSFGNFLEGFGGDYEALGAGFNDPADCTYETYALFEWIIEFEVLEHVTMQIVATLFAEVVPPVVGESLHYISVSEQGALAPIWIGESEADEADEFFDESIPLDPGLYEFAVYARPLLQGTGGVATLESGWIYDVVFEVD